MFSKWSSLSQGINPSNNLYNHKPLMKYSKDIVIFTIIFHPDIKNRSMILEEISI